MLTKRTYIHYLKHFQTKEYGSFMKL